MGGAETALSKPVLAMLPCAQGADLVEHGTSEMRGLVRVWNVLGLEALWNAWSGTLRATH